MNTIRLSITAILAVLSATQSLAQSSDFSPVLATASYRGTQSVMPAAYQNSANKNEGVAASQTSDHESSIKALWNAAGIHTNALSMETSRGDMIMSNDHASLAIYAPMQAVNGALSFAGFVSQSRLSEPSVTWIQILSLAARRQINTELKYSVNMSAHSKFDSFVAYRLNPDHDPTRTGVSAGLRYNIKF